VTTRIVFVVITVLGCLALPSINLHAQAEVDVAQQIKDLQQQSRDAQMKNDVSWAQQHLADGFVAGNSWGAIAPALMRTAVLEPDRLVPTTGGD